MQAAAIDDQGKIIREMRVINDGSSLRGFVKGLSKPLKGFSHHDSPEGHLHDPSLCPVSSEALKKALPSSVPVIEFDCHINDPQFADAIVERVLASTHHAAS